jgi:ornithine cyclodeaminase
MRLRLLSAADIAAALPMAECIAVMKQAFADFTSGRAQVPQRTVMTLGAADDAATLLVKPAFIPAGPGATAGLGAKLISVFPANTARGLPVSTGVVVLLDPATGEPAALLDGTFLTAWRTGAASGAATDLLARADARRGAVFGAGAQARTQVLAIDAARELAEIRLYAPTPAKVETLVTELQPRTRARLVAVASPSVALADAEVVCAATNSRRPVFDGLHLAEGAHVNGVGSYTPQMQEIDLETVLRARIFVDSLASASLEPGDLIEAVAAGVTDPGEWTELGAVVLGETDGRRAGDDLTFFKSVGLAVQDIAAGALVLARATAQELGQIVDF